MTGGRDHLISGLQDFLTASARQFAGHGSPVGHELSDALHQVDASQARLSRQRAFEPPHFQGLLQQSVAECTQPLALCSACLPWRKPGFGKLPSKVSDRIDVVEIVGPDAMLINRQIRFGLLIQQPDHIYPEHHHAAEELYFTLAGQASWTVNKGTPGMLGPGQFSHHAPWQSHTMTTGPAPMLACWGWVGEIDAGTYGLPESP